MDFKIGDEIEEEGNESSESKLKIKSKLPMIIVISIALIVGITVFVVSYGAFGPKKPKETPTREQLTLNEANVEILYDYVTNGPNDERLEIFLKEPRVTIDTFTNQEKFECALQFAKSDDFELAKDRYEKDLNTGESKPVYLITDSKIRKYMTQFFGNKVTYSKEGEVKYLFGENEATMKFSDETQAYETTFTKVEKKEENTYVDKYYTELTAAYKELDGTYTLEEKVIYPVVEKQEDSDKYTLSIYKDYKHEKVIETKNNLTKEDIQKLKINMKDYKSKAATITYKFALNGNILYFQSSTIR